MQYGMKPAETSKSMDCKASHSMTQTCDDANITDPESDSGVSESGHHDSLECDPSPPYVRTVCFIGAGYVGKSNKVGYCTIHRLDLLELLALLLMLY